MNDAIALLAVSQLVCIGGLAYLFLQLQSLRTRRTGPGRRPPSHVRHVDQGAAPLRSPGQPALRAYLAEAGRARDQLDALPVGARLSELGIDIPALARRMHRSEEEVRLLLRRQGVPR